MNDNVNDKTVSEDSVELNLYTEISTGRTYEGKLFETFVLVRPVLPHLWKHTQKVSLIDFGKLFEDFQGNREEVRQFLARNPEMSWKNVTIN